MKLLLTAKTLKEEKYIRYELQEGICSICNRPLDTDVLSNHLDHDHELHKESTRGRVRGLLCPFCNSLEGQIKHKFEKSGLESRGVDMSTWLHELIKYYDQDTSNNRIHPTYITDKVNWFSRQTKPIMIEELQSINAPIDEKMTKVQLTNLYRKQLRIYHATKH